MTLSVHDFRLQKTLSRVEFDVLAGAAAAALRTRLPEARGARVVALARNGVEMLALMQACFNVGAVFVPVNWRLARLEVAALLKDCQASLVFVQDEFRPLVEATTIPCWPLDLNFGAAAGTAPDATPPAAAPDDQLAILLYTSGTSGRPKAAMLSMGNLRANSYNFRTVADVQPDSGLLCDAPMFHTIGLMAISFTSLVVGARLYLSPAFVATDTVDRIGNPQCRITHYFTVPQVAQQLLQAANFTAEKFRGLRALFTGGAPLAPALIEAWGRNGVTLINGYGSTEAGTVMHMRLDNPAAQVHKAGSVGMPVPHIEVSLRDRAGRSVAAGQVGEIWLRGPSVASGYWGLEAETRQSFGDGWFRTGDAARRDPDGYYYIVDRWKDMYISGGENVYPAEVENVLARMPGIAEATVVGQPDPAWGEVGEAFIVLAPGARLSAEDVTRHVRAHVAGYKVPKRVSFVASLPRTASGKVRKIELRRMSTG
jgi:fatty-acyl-CoA synthase